MQISEHYLGYPKKTAIVVTNNELAKILIAHEQEINEEEVLHVSTELPDDRPTNAPNSGSPDVDEIKKHSRQELYGELSDRLMEHTKKDVEEIILCAPEANKNALTEEMHTDVMKHVTEVVPKNLASLPLDAIIRILQESRA